MTDTVPPDQAELTGEVLFYSQPEPLSKEAHGGLGLKRIDRPYAFTALTHIVPLTVTEFGPAALCYPVIFLGDQRQPVAVMGVNSNQNLFVNDEGVYDADAYLPAYVRRYPFVFANDDQNERMVVCIDRGATMISDKPDFPFFENGELSKFSQDAIEFCRNFETERQRTESFVQLITDLDLWEPKQTHFTPQNPDGTAGQPQLIAEYQGVSEEKLNKLPAEKFVELRDNGALAQIYSHLNSLLGWDRLLVRALGRAPIAANA